MRFRTLGSSGLSVSEICLGTMTWGIQNTQQDADEQLDYAVGTGINFIDTAEMYPVPPGEETFGGTETILGNWLAANRDKRDDLIVMTKIAGPGFAFLRNGEGITGENVVKAVDASLARLQTDYIDVYQLHWPNRTTPHFGKHWPNSVRFSELDKDLQVANMLDILQGLDACIKAGKIRHFGLSDDTTWGINTYLRLAEQHNLPSPVSIQNEFNLLHAKDWPFLVENCIHEDVAYLPWSPLAGGMLSGKYLDGARPEGSRWTLTQRMGLFRNTELSEAAVRAYADVAREAGITPSQLALAWCAQVDGVTSTIIGATSLAQLKENTEAFELVLSDDIKQKVATVFQRYPVPF